VDVDVDDGLAEVHPPSGERRRALLHPGLLPYRSLI
jgi:hypothetical protein